MNTLDNRHLEQLSNLEFVASQVVEGFITGLHKSPFHGFSVEFAEHRLYNKGESTKHIDWKLFGRTDKLFVKRFEEETNLRCQVVIDHSASMYYPVDAKVVNGITRNKITFSVYAAAALTMLLKRQRDAIGLSLFDSDVTLHSPAKSSVVHLKMLFSEYEKLLNTKPDHKPQKTSVVKALHTIAESVHKRSLIVIFSDMFDNASNSGELFSALQHLRHNKHEVILFHVVDKSRELEFEFENRPYTFVDVESGEELKLNPAEVKESYLKSIAKYKNDLALKCAQYKIDFVEADVNQGFEQVLMPYLLKRGKLY